MRIGIVGPGSVGGALAAILATRHEVVLCGRRGFVDLEVELAVDSVAAPPRTIARPRLDAGAFGSVDWVVFATKVHHTAAAVASWWPGLVGPGARVAVVQNGIEHLAHVPSDWPRARVTPVLVDVAAAQVAPGRVRVSRAPRLVVPDDAAGGAFAALANGVGLPAQTVADFTTAAWRKLCINVVTGAVPVLAAAPRRVFLRADVQALCRQLLVEAVVVARAAGADLGIATADDLLRDLVADAAAYPDGRPSMLQDLLAGKELELEARNGAVLRAALRAGVAVPLLVGITALLRARAGQAPV